MSRGVFKANRRRNRHEWGVAFHAAFQLLIVVSLVSFSLETMPDLSLPFMESLARVEDFTVAVFTLEYVLRIYVATDRLAMSSVSTAS